MIDLEGTRRTAVPGSQAGYFQSRFDFLKISLAEFTGLFVAGVFLLHILAAWLNGGFFNPDEHFLIIEFAQYKLGFQSLAGIAWEYPAHLKPGLQVWLAAGAIRGWHALGFVTPFGFAVALRVLSALLALWAALEVNVRCLRSVDARWLRIVALSVSFLLWITPTVHARFSSENWGGLWLAGGFCLMLDAADDVAARRGRAIAMAIATGLMWSAAFYCRYQLGFCIAGAWLWLLLVARAPIGLTATVAGALLVGCGVNVVIDHWLYNAWTLSPYNYFMFNIVQGGAATFGVSPWWMLIVYMAVALIPPYSIAVLALLASGLWFARRNVLVWITVPLALVHIVIGHKEPRFIAPLLYFVGPLIAVSAQALPRRIADLLASWLRTRTGRTQLALWGALNALVLCIMVQVPVDDAYGAHRWLWDHSRRERLTVYTAGVTPYHEDHDTNSFYRSANVTSLPLESLGPPQATPVALVYYRGAAPPDTVTALGPCEPLVRAFPAWLSPLNSILSSEISRKLGICRLSR